jgi:Rod binding domain-containing protein
MMITMTNPAITAATAPTALPATGASTPQPRLVHAAHEFEAQMMKELLKPLSQNDGLTGSGDQGDDEGSGGALGEFASEALGRALSDAGGFGIASSIVKQLTPKGNHTPPSAVTRNPHGNTAIKATQ